MSDKWDFWIDRGGTFTDIIGISPEGNRVTKKLLSKNRSLYKDSIIEGIRSLLEVESSAPFPSCKVGTVKIGTTVSTNALLQRRGEPVLLCITRGFGDALKIGYQQRPELFDRQIKLPAPLYNRVYEVDERIGRDGLVIKEPCPEEISIKFTQYVKEGISSIAIVLMHGWRYNSHELLLKKLARESGFSDISISSEVSPVMGFISRGDTTVLDAYLSPLLDRYVTGLASVLKRSRLLFMQSGGGLVTSTHFRGKNSILSGPAGGVAGIIKSATGEGFKRIIGFDMGGTSTDVSHYNGLIERCQEKIVGGIRVRAPAIMINTVASGGGSRLFFDGMRYRVGPESAGSDPGPCCYGNGGPLTITDANLIAGKIIPSSFPKVFGPAGNLPLNRELSLKEIDTLKEEVEAATGKGLARENIAEGFITIANQSMALAIKEVSVARGYDVTGYTLCCFGGAGGQHACNVADLLGVEKIYIPPYAGVLSALGIGLSALQASAEKSVERLLSADSSPEIESEFTILEESVLRCLAEQGARVESVTVTRKIDIRYEGTNTPFTLDHASMEELRKKFAKKHERYFGFLLEGKELVVETVKVEAVCPPDPETIKGYSPAKLSRSVSACPGAECETKVFTGGRWWRAPVYRRDALRAGFSLNGPAIILEESGTTVLEPGWRLSVSERGGLLLARSEVSKKSFTQSSKCDPVLLEIFNNIFGSVAEQMGHVLERTASSTNIKERRDFSCAVFDRSGGLIASAPHIPVHLGAMGESVMSVIREKGELLAPGDVLLTNDPFHGGSHLPDITVVSPLFNRAGDELLFFVASRGHHADIGGVTPGSMPATSHHIKEEGILFRNEFLMKRGVFRVAEIVRRLKSGPYPARNIDQNISDLKAQVAANNRGLHELREVIGEYGLKMVNAYTRFIQQNAEEAVRRVISGLNPGEFVDFMDEGERIEVKISIDNKKRSATVDFSGTSTQCSGNMNAPVSVTYAAVIYVFRTLIEDKIPLNSGFLRPFKIIVPEGSMLNPEYPAAVSGGNVEVSMRVVDVLYGALKTMGAGQGTMNNFTFGNKNFQYYETVAGGSGAGAGFDGESGVHTHMTNTRITDPETLEWRYPVILNEFSIRPGSGGEGEYKGGDGLRRKIMFLEEMEVGILSDRRRTRPYGMAGGCGGTSGKNTLVRNNRPPVELKGKVSLNVSPFDSILIETPGGGGYGRKV